MIKPNEMANNLLQQDKILDVMKAVDDLKLIPAKIDVLEDLTQDEKLAAQRISDEFKADTKSLNYFFGEYYQGLLIERTSDKYTQQAIEIVCDTLGQMTIQILKVLGIPLEILEHIKFSFKIPTDMEKFYSMKEERVTWAELTSSKVSESYYIDISLYYPILLRNMLEHHRNNFAIDGGESNEAELKETEYYIDVLCTHVRSSMAHEIYHLAQKYYGIDYGDGKPENSNYKKYTERRDEATANLFAHIMSAYAKHDDKKKNKLTV